MNSLDFTRFEMTHGANLDKPAPRDFVIVGKITGVFGVRGGLKVFSYTQPAENILSYSPWVIERGGAWEEYRVRGGHAQGHGVVAFLEGCSDRDAAAELVMAQVTVRRAQLPATRAGEYYWAELIGLRIVTVDGIELGRVSQLFETGANDVLVVTGERERMIPFVREHVVREVSMERGEIVVDWDPEF